MNDLQRAGTKVTKATISNTRRREGLKSCSARRVPLLKPVHVQARLKFAREHMDDPEEDWENIMGDRDFQQEASHLSEDRRDDAGSRAQPLPVLSHVKVSDGFSIAPTHTRLSTRMSIHPDFKTLLFL
ncbi:hypothetical protein AOLI_G00246230 [Acnodon oligacanthus]